MVTADSLIALVLGVVNPHHTRHLPTAYSRSHVSSSVEPEGSPVDSPYVGGPPMADPEGPTR